MLAIIASRADRASEHVGEHLLDLADWDEVGDDAHGTVYRLPHAELRFFEERHLDMERAAEVFDDPDLLVFASRHAGETGRLLTAHHTGNFGPAEHGGEDYAFARACPNAHRRVVHALAEHAPEGYDAGMECTHHGPTDVGAPSMFVEVGSTEAQWEDPEAARAVARAILDLRGVDPDAPAEDGRRKHLVGLGGGHYVPRFERVVRETDWAVGHVAADWCLDDMGDPRERRDVLERAFEASAAEYALLATDDSDLRAVVEDLGHRVVSETWVRETTGVSLPLVERLEDAMGSIGDGLRLGDPAETADGDAPFAVVSLPEDLLAEARGIDEGRTRDIVTGSALAYATEHNGSTVRSPVAVPEEGDRAEIVSALADVLRERYDEVDREGETLVVRETAFDPERAKIRGVPEGPKFGKLSSGEPVEVNGETVRPEAVSRERERRFDLGAE